MFCFFPVSLKSSTYTDKNSPFLGLQISILNRELFPKCILIELSRTKDDRTDFVQEEQPDLPYWTHDFGHLCFGRRIQNIWIFGPWEFSNTYGASSIFTWVLADTASAAFPEHPGSLEIMSMILAAVICDADDPCSVNTAYDPESFFIMSPWSTTLPLYF